MADFRPFKSIRYDVTVAGSAEMLIAPPYDVVAPDDRLTIYMRGPFNVSLIDYGEERPTDDEEGNRYTRARLDLEAWHNLGILKRDEEPRLFYYEQEFEVVTGQRLKRHSIFGRLRLEEWEKRIILPHEETRTGPKEDRLRLLQSTRVNTSPILALYEPEDVQEISQAALGNPVFQAGDYKERHLLRPVSPSAAEAFTNSLANARLYIADGHHRYETGLNYRNERRAESPNWTGEEPENFILAALISTADPGLVILPTHRLVRFPQRPADLRERLEALFHIEPAGEVSDFSIETLVAKMAAAARDGTAFGLVGLEPKKLHLLRAKDNDQLIALTPPDKSDEWRKLDVSILQDGVLPAIGFDGQPDHIEYTEWPYHAATEVTEGRWDLAFLLNATRVQQVLNIADRNELMPHKSTFFFPKLATGVVMYPLD
jgi:uncharacterized protein (DUF1015 family)